MKSKFTLWSVVLLLAGFIFVGCDNERTENASDFQTGIHKIVIQQSGDTDSFEVSVSIGGADKGGPAKLYNDKGEYIGDSYSAQIRTATMFLSYKWERVFHDLCRFGFQYLGGG